MNYLIINLSVCITKNYGLLLNMFGKILASLFYLVSSQNNFSNTMIYNLYKHIIVEIDQKTTKGFITHTYVVDTFLNFLWVIVNMIDKKLSIEIYRYF